AGFGVGALLLVGLAIGHKIFLPRTAPSSPSSASEPPSSASRRSLAHVGKAYTSFLRQDRVLWVIAFLLTYKMADVLMFSMSKVLFDRELGIGTDLRGGFINTAGTLASITGAVIGGAWISRRGLGRTLVVIT